MNVLITGGTGMIGTRLTQMLQEQGYTVSYLSRDNTTKIPKVKVYLWKLQGYQLDAEAIDRADCIVHLAGTGVADKRWTPERKEEIRKSRTMTLEMLLAYIKRSFQRPKIFISASGISYYGCDTGDEPMYEDSPAGDDFLANVTKDWEKYANLVSKLEEIRTVIFRTGIVLSKKGGALPQLARPIKWFVGSPLGSGQQYVSWIHIDDLCRMIIKAIKDDRMVGTYNAVAPTPVTNAEMGKTIAQVLHRPFFLPNVPAKILKIVLGEMSKMILGGNKVINQRISKETNFRYLFPGLKGALKDLYEKKRMIN